jgi:hybrid cluster-associated redox disulfide protein
MKITRKTIMREVLKAKPEAAGILFGAGLTCVGCPLNEKETLEEGCYSHGLNDGEINEILEELNMKK